MRTIPLDVLYSFPLPNYTHPQTRGPALVIINAVLLGFVTLVVVLRIYTRTVVKRSVGYDDYSMIIGYVFTVGLVVLVILANYKYYWEHHWYDIPVYKIPVLGKSVIAAKELFTTATTFIRFSLLLFYYRQVKNARQRHFRAALNASMAFNVAIWIAFTVLTLANCNPLHAYWDYPSHGHCLDDGIVTFAGGVVDCFADLLTTALAIPIVLHLRMAMSQRIGAILLLCLGFIVTIAGGVRTYFIWKAMIDTYDETWYSYPLWIAAVIEVQLGLIIACIPTLCPLIAVYFPGYCSPTRRSRTMLNVSHSRDGSHTTTVTTNLGKSGTTSKSPSNQYYTIGPEREAVSTEPYDLERLVWIQPPREQMQIYQRKSVEVRRDTLPHDFDVERPIPVGPFDRNEPSSRSPSAPLALEHMISRHHVSRDGVAPTSRDSLGWPRYTCDGEHATHVRPHTQPAESAHHHALVDSHAVRIPRDEPSWPLKEPSVSPEPVATPSHRESLGSNRSVKFTTGERRYEILSNPFVQQRLQEQQQQNPGRNRVGLMGSYSGATSVTDT